MIIIFVVVLFWQAFECNFSCGCRLQLDNNELLIKELVCQAHDGRQTYKVANI